MTTSASPPGIYKYVFKAKDLISGVENTKVEFELVLQATQLTIEPNPINDVEFNIDGTSAFTTIPIP